MEAQTYDCPNCGAVYLDANGNGRACFARLEDRKQAN